jgi:hypothetical protein
MKPLVDSRLHGNDKYVGFSPVSYLVFFVILFPSLTKVDLLFFSTHYFGRLGDKNVPAWALSGWPPAA